MSFERTILDFSFEECAAYMKSVGEKSFRARQVFDWIYHKGVLDFDQMKNLSQSLRDRLKKECPFPRVSCLEKQMCPAETKKYLFQWMDGQTIESVVIPSEQRMTVCISCQAGCKFACRFCASGIGGWVRNLSCGEILMQILQMQSYEKRRVTHVVFMGMGEPLDNWPAVQKAISVINSAEGMDIAARRITLSTCGIVPALKNVADFGRQIELAVSLHGYNDETRGQLMPVNQRYSLKELILACREYVKQTNRQITFEYILIDGLTCTTEAPGVLAKILKGLLCKVNLIPYNLVEEFDWKAPSRDDIYAFRDALIEKGVHATIRWSKGKNAHGACGQLRSRNR